MSRLGNVGGRLYRGEVSFDFVGRQKLWYAISGLILLLSLVGLFARGLNFTVDFKGGSVITIPASSVSSISQVQSAVSTTGDGAGRHRPARRLGQQRHLAGADGQAGLLPGAEGPVRRWPGSWASPRARSA